MGLRVALFLSFAACLSGCGDHQAGPADAAVVDVGVDAPIDAGPPPFFVDGGRCFEPEGENGISTLECGVLPCRTCELLPSHRPLVGCIVAKDDLCVLDCARCLETSRGD